MTHTATGTGPRPPACLCLIVAALALSACSSAATEPALAVATPAPSAPPVEGPDSAPPSPHSAPSRTPPQLPLATLEVLPAPIAQSYESPPSPDGRWVVRHLVHDEARSVPSEDGTFEIYVYESQHLTATDGLITHTFRTEWIPEGIGVDVSRPAFEGWAPNSSAAFVSMVAAAGGCVANFPSDSVQRVDVADGAVTELGSVGGSPSLSPDGSRIGGVRGVEGHQVEFVWLDTSAGNPQTIRLDIPLDDDPIASGQEAPPIWSPDAQAVIIPFDYEPCMASWRNRLVYLDVATGESQIIWEPDESVGRIQFEGWDESGHISFTAWTGGYLLEPGGAVPVFFDTTTGRWQGR